MGSMSKVELIAKALGGTVIEDQGYRGIIHVPEQNHYVRYHSAYGVHVVQRLAKTWRVARTVLTLDEVDGFLKEAGVLPDITATANPLVELANALHGDVVQKFHAGGGVIKLPNGVCLRFSHITGLDLVELIVTKWRSVRHVASRSETLRALMEGRVPQLLEDAVPVPVQSTAEGSEK